MSMIFEFDGHSSDCYRTRIDLEHAGKGVPGKKLWGRSDGRLRARCGYLCDKLLRAESCTEQLLVINKFNSSQYSDSQLADKK
jgi:hypothetical protein